MICVFFVDHCSVEIFAQDGQVTMTELIFPDPESVSVAINAPRLIDVGCCELPQCAVTRSRSSARNQSRGHAY